jgi:YHS domain-containing protein
MRQALDLGLFCSDFGISGVTTFQSSEGETTMKSETAVQDHVCGMDIETATAAARTQYKGQTYSFCGSNCKEKFDRNPEQYLCKSAEMAKSGHGCCG